MIRSCLRVFAAVLAFFPCGLAYACSLDVDTVGLTSWSGSDGRGYDVFDENVYYQPLTLKVSSSEGDCPFYVTAAATVTGGAGGLLSGPGKSLIFEVFRDASGAQALRPAPLATQSEVLTGTATEKGAPVMFQVAYSIPALQIVDPGVYAGQITVAVYEGSFGSGTLRAQKQIPLSITIPSIAEISFTAGAFGGKKKYATVEFGLMYAGEIKGLTLYARGNAGYRIAVSSRNGGAMRRSDPLDQSAVPYTFSVDGRTIPLGESETDAVTYQGATNALGNAHRFDFTVGSLADATAGDYEDTVTVTIMSLR